MFYHKPNKVLFPTLERYQRSRLQLPQNRDHVDFRGTYSVFGVPLDVFRQMVGTHEPPVANVALELFLAGVRPLVPGQFVRSREPPAAIGPLANERLLAGVGSVVRLQMRRFEVVFAAAFVLALVDAPPLRLLRRR